MLKISINNKIIVKTEDISKINLFEITEKVKINPPNRSVLTLDMDNMVEARQLKQLFDNYLNGFNIITVRDGYEFIHYKFGYMKFKIKNNG